MKVFCVLSLETSHWGDSNVISFSIKMNFILQSRKENPQKLTQLSSRSQPRHLVGKRTAQKDTIIDITSDSQVNSNFPYRWSPASLTFYNYFYLFLYLYITLITINNNAPHLKSPKQLFDFSKGLKNVETAVVNEPSMLEPKKAKTDTLSGIIYRYLKSPLGIKL